ncbi:MAG: hypothetical protein AAFQ83_10025 [Bacteroidota bacterium]
MKKHFNDEDLIRFLYDEMSQEEADHLLSILCTDEKLWQRYEELQDTITEVKMSELSPSVEVCDQIMAYVKDSALIEEAATQTPQNEPVLSKTRIRNQSSLSLLVAAGIGLFMLATVFGSFGKVARTTAQDPGTGQFTQEQPVVNFQWEDDEIEENIESINQRLQKITGEKVM